MNLSANRKNLEQSINLFLDPTMGFCFRLLEEYVEKF
jgi:hypothetical protein